MPHPGTPVVIAHRGASGYLPEHTAAAYQLALELGADAVEPDVVPSRDGVLVVRHENELSGTTDIADRADLRDRRTTKEIDGKAVEGWFAEDLTWAQLSTLRAREPHPALRPASARADRRWGVLRLADVIGIVQDRAHVVIEVKHPTTFQEAGLPMPELLEAELAVAGAVACPQWLTVESFEKSFLEAAGARGLRARRVYLAEATGAAYDLVARDGAAATPYRAELDDVAGLAARRVTTPDGPEPLLHGISLAKSTLLQNPVGGHALVRRAHAAGLTAWTYTLRPENAFLDPRHRAGPDRDHGRWRTEFAAIAATGVDGVFADHPDLVREVIAPACLPSGRMVRESPEDEAVG